MFEPLELIRAAGSKHWSFNDQKAINKWAREFSNYLETSKLSIGARKTHNNISIWQHYLALYFAFRSHQPIGKKKLLQKNILSKLTIQKILQNVLFQKLYFKNT